MVRKISVYIHETMTSGSVITNSERLQKFADISQWIRQNQKRGNVHVFVTLRLESLHSLLIKLPECHINRLQLIQNNAASLVMIKRIECRIAPILKELHWLPVEYGIQCKILLLVNKCFCDNEPT